MIEKISIRNFKSISEQQDINLSNFSVIVGNNGVGKSNLLNAISLVKNLVAGQTIDQATEKILYATSELFNRNSSASDSEITLVLKNGTDQTYKFAIRIGLEKKSDGPTLVIKYERVDLCSGNSCDPVYERNGDDLFNAVGAKIPLDLPSKLAAISQYKNPELSKIKRLFARVYVPDIDTASLIEKIQGLVYTLIRDPKNYEKFMKMTQGLLPSLATFEKIEFPKGEALSEDADEYMVLVTEKNMKGRLSFKALSHGDLRTLYFLAVAIISDDYSTFVFDEIENGIHPERICKIIEFLSNVTVGSNKQFIFSTHSTKIINYVRPQQVIYVSKIPGVGTTFKELGSGDEISGATKVLENGGDLYDYIKSRF